MIEFVIGHFNIVTYVLLMMIGFYAMTGKTKPGQEARGDEHLPVVDHPVRRLARGEARRHHTDRRRGARAWRGAGPRGGSVRQPITSRAHADSHRGGSRHDRGGPGPAPPDPQTYGTLEEDELLERIRSSGHLR